MYLNKIRQPKFVKEVEIKAEFAPEEPTIKELTYNELRKELQDKGVTIPRNAKKKQLIKLLEGENEEV